MFKEFKNRLTEAVRLQPRIEVLTPQDLLTPGGQLNDLGQEIHAFDTACYNGQLRENLAGFLAEKDKRDNYHVFTTRSKRDHRLQGVLECTVRVLGSGDEEGVLLAFQNSLKKEGYSLKPGAKAVYINNLAVGKNYRDQGVAQRLCRQMAREFKPAYIVAFSRSAPAVRAMQKTWEEKGFLVYASGVPLGKYNLYLSAEYLFDSLGRYNPLFSLIDAYKILCCSPEGYRTFTSTIIKMDKSGDLRGDIVLARPGTFQFLEPFFERLQQLSRDHLESDYTLPIIAIHPNVNRVPLIADCGAVINIIDSDPSLLRFF